MTLLAIKERQHDELSNTPSGIFQASLSMRSVYNIEDGRDLTLVDEGRVDSTALFKLSLKFLRGAVSTAQAMTSATARRRRYMDRTASNHPTLQNTESSC